ncbi:MAG TPA: transglutaminase-like domain-containing protein [Leptolinea sp.]
MLEKLPRLWDRLSIVLILICIWIPAALLRSTGWAPDLDQAEFLGLAGVILGLWIGRSAFRAFWAHLSFLLFSFTIPIWLFSSRMTAPADWLSRLGSLLQRIISAGNQAFSGRMVQDPLVFIIFCAYFLWFSGYFTGYNFTRKANPWQGLLATAGIFGVVDFYSNSPAGANWIGAALVFCLFLLAARLFWIKRKQVWDEEGFFIERDAGESVFRVAGILALVLVILSWNLQGIIRSFTEGTPEYEKVSMVWKDVQSSLQNNFVGLHSTSTLTGSYPGGLKFGSQAPLQQTPAFQVQVVSKPAVLPRIYWRIRIYQEYNNGQWQASPLLEEGNYALSQEELKQTSAFSEVVMRYSWKEAEGVIIPFAGKFIGIDIPAKLKPVEGSGHYPGDGILLPQNLVKRDDNFRVDSAVFTGNQEDLRNVPYSIPDQISAQNLQIPDTLPRRVRDLAAQIAVGGSVFDRVMAVTEYLRNNYVYRSQIDSVPDGKDPVDWFLFDSKQGFCTYYASAEVLLLRSAGIPARLAVGYSQGETVDVGFLVRMDHGHAWPEVYFPEMGWIPFEPTASQPDLQFPKTSEEVMQPTAEISPQERRASGETNPQPAIPADGSSDINRLSPAKLVIYLLFAIIGLACVVTIWLVYRGKLWKKPPSLPNFLLRWLKSHQITIPDWLAWWAWYSGLSEVAVQYFWIERLAVLAGTAAKLPATPAELLFSMAEKIPEIRTTILIFQNGLYQELYSQEKSFDLNECKAAGAALQRALLIRIWNRLIHFNFL